MKVECNLGVENLAFWEVGAAYLIYQAVTYIGDRPVVVFEHKDPFRETVIPADKTRVERAIPRDYWEALNEKTGKR